MKKYIDEYFEKQGIRVIYNTLGHTDELVNAYVKETYDMFANSRAKFTNAIKTQIYSKYYVLTPRIKMTGFEQLKNIDDNFRKFVYKPTIQDRWNTPSHVFDVFKKDNENYIDILKTNLKKIENPLLFYSGGIDSELVLHTFLDIGIKPTVVIFEFVDEQGLVINQYDINHALKYCSEKNINPIVKQICPETLWNQNDFLALSHELRIGSPQILTHVYMAKIIAEEYSNHTYCFGGEIRYQKYSVESINKTVLVSSTKNIPGLGSIYTASSASGTTTALCTLITNSSTVLVGGAAYWEVLQTGGSSSGSPVFGYYSDITRPPDFNYEFRFDWVEIQDDQGTNGSISGSAVSAGSGNYYTPTNSNTTNSNQVNFTVSLTSDLAGYTADYTFDWFIRNATSPGTVVSDSSQFTVTIV